jgi:hypothetical protein
MKFIISLFFCTNLFAVNLKDLQKERIENYFKIQADSALEELSTIGEMITVKNKLIDLKVLRNSLIQTELLVRDEELIDNTGSLVDIIGAPKKLIFNFDSWIGFQKTNNDLRPLIIHELLRVSGINDDDYYLSSSLYSLLGKVKKMKSVVSLPYCNLRVAKTKTVIKRKKFSGTGYEPIQSNGNGFFSSYGQGQVSYDNAIIDINEKCEKSGYYGLDYISGETKTSRSNSNGYIKVEKRTDIKAYCFKDKIKKRKTKNIRKEFCQKIKICDGIYQSAPSGQVSKEGKENLRNLTKENRCAR